ncbi:MAG: ABC transporter ATP-binding protein [Emergencia sp.]
MDVLQLRNVSKAFGSSQVLDGLTLTVPPRTVFAFAGENGAGKTTTMKIIMGLLAADSGSVSVCGKPVVYGRSPGAGTIGYLPDVPAFYDFMTPSEYLSLCGRIMGLPSSEIRAQSKKLLELVGLNQNNKRILGFSRGMKQRLGIAQALLGNPSLLICDEPTSALDPSGRKDILEILSSVRETTAVLFSTHILADAERICDQAAFLHHGKITVEGSVSDLTKRCGGSLEDCFMEVIGQ